MSTWQLQEAKAKFSELVKLSQLEPQIVSVRGREEAVILSVKQYRKLTNKKKLGLIELLQSSPLGDIDITITRDKSKGREISL